MWKLKIHNVHEPSALFARKERRNLISIHYYWFVIDLCVVCMFIKNIDFILKENKTEINERYMYFHTESRLIFFNIYPKHIANNYTTSLKVTFFVFPNDFFFGWTKEFISIFFLIKLGANIVFSFFSFGCMDF